jgi:RNA polymerase-binding protein DksA
MNTNTRKAVFVAKKKKTAKKSSKKNKSKLTDKDIEYFKQLLLVKRREIMGDVSEMENEALKKSRSDATGDLSSMPIHMADIGSDNYQQEFSLNLMAGERRMLKEIDEALGKIQDGTYGICEGTGKTISKARLKAQPWAKYSMEYARMLEEGAA